MHINDVQSQFSNSRVSMKKIFLAELLSLIYKHMISSKFRTNHRITLDILDINLICLGYLKRQR